MTDQPPDHDPEIVNERISDPAVGSDASSHDPDDHWLETVLTSLPERSREAQKALLKALLDGAARGNPAGLTTIIARKAAWSVVAGR